MRCVAILDHDIQKKLIKAAHDNTALSGSISQISSEVHLGPGDVHALSAPAVASHRVCTFSSKANNRNIGIMARPIMHTIRFCLWAHVPVAVVGVSG